MSAKPRLLDLFCGAGGASMGYAHAGFEVVGVDIAPQPRYPFTFHQADALTFPFEGFDVVHASPPCQAFTAYCRRPAHVKPSADLIAQVRARIHAWGGVGVIENIGGSTLRPHVTRLCGSAFGIDVRRHRYFESTVLLMWSGCQHYTQAPRFKQATNRQNKRRTIEVGVWRIPLPEQRRAMGIDWMTLEELSEAIPPAYTEFLGRQLVAVLAEAVA